MRARLAVGLLLGSATALTAAADPASGQVLSGDTACHSRISWRFLPPQPVFTPYTAPPQLLDRGAARSAIEAEYPPALRAAGAGGITTVWLFIDECGRVRVARVRASSGNADLDSAAVRAAATFRFSPALQGQFSTPVWVALPIVFGNPRIPPPQTGGPSRDTVRVPLRVRTDGLLRFPGPPGFTGPSLLNESDVVGRLLERYAPLRDEGVRGTVVLTLHLDLRGRVTDAAIASHSGDTRLDDIALDVARGMVFFPAVDRHRRYSSVTTTVPVRFGN